MAATYGHFLTGIQRLDVALKGRMFYTEKMQTEYEKQGLQPRRPT